MVVNNIMNMPRLLTAMITPYDENLQVDYRKAGEIAEYLCENGTDAIVVCGTTGEAPVLSDDEKIQMFTAVKERVGSKAPVWAGTGSNNTAHTIELSQAAEKSGADGLLLVTPYYNKPSQEGLYQHFKAIAESVKIPVMLYNVPGRTSCNLLPDTVARLAEVENIVAIKEASGNLDQTSQLKSLVPADFIIYSGDDSLTLPMMALGAQGVVSIASHIVGKELKQMINAFTEGNVETALSLHNKLFPIFKGLFVTTNPVPLKEALNMMGKEVGGFRLPLTNASEKEKSFIKDLLEKNNLI